MKPFGTPQLNKDGTLMLPKEVRELTEWRAGDLIGVYYADHNTVVLKLVKDIENKCGICEQNRKFLSIKGLKICRECVSIIIKRAIMNKHEI